MHDQNRSTKYRHLLSILTLAIFTFIGVFVPQIRFLIKDLFQQEETRFTLGFLTSVLILWIAGVLLHFWFTTPRTERLEQLMSRLPTRFKSIFRFIDRTFFAFPLGFLFRQANRFRVLGEASIGYPAVFTMFIGGFLAAYLVPVRFAPDTWIDSAWPLAGGFFRMLGVLSMAIAVWLFFGRRYGTSIVLDSGKHPAFGEDSHRKKKVWKRAGEALSALMWLVLVLECVWIAAEYKLLGVTHSVYSVWTFFALAAAACIVASLIDFLDHNTQFWWRAGALAFIAVALSLPGQVELTPTASRDSPEQTPYESEGTYAAESQDELPTKEAGSVWLDAAEARLQQMPDGPVVIVTASGGGSRAALAAVLSLEEIEAAITTNERPACIWLCSGVSGGGIALATYFCSGQKQLSATDAVSQDYLAPMFRGFLVPFQNRGEALSDFWNRKFQWNEVYQLSMNPERPLLVYGVSDIDLGRRIMVGFPRLPSSWYSRWVRDPVNQEWKLSDREYTPYSLSTLRHDGQLLNTSLTRAVRMSSSFPFGFEPTKVRVDHPDPTHSEPVNVHFLDGGMIDNTGLDSVVAILRGLVQSENKQAIEVLQILRKRGVFLIEIDAGAGPGETASSGPLHRVTQSVAGYNRGVFSSAMRSRDENIEVIRQLVGEKRFVYEPIQPIPATKDVSEIMTTLALPRKDVVRLTRAFDNARSVIRSTLHDRYDTLVEPRRGQNQK